MYTILIPIILGWVGGMMINYLADVLPGQRRLVKPFCFHCSHSQALRNYLLWPRRCKNCNKKRSLRVTGVEIICILISLYLYSYPPENLGFSGSMVLIIYFGVVLIVDLEFRLILHPVSIAGSILGIAIGTYLHGIGYTLIGGAAGFLIMLLLYYFGEVFSRITTRLRGENLDEVALGFGDVNLSAVLGLILGWPGILMGLLMAILLGGIFSAIYIIILILQGRYRTFTAIPYGPFLLVAASLLIFLPDDSLWDFWALFFP